jgi:glycosyltransferase involved in cell wall biosynthesis
VDDHSTADDPQAVVREVAGERVAFYRNPRSLGAAGNFNQCIAHTRGRWIHILHGDDAVRPGF